MPLNKANTYIGRRVAVTGGASFIGSHLCERLVSLGANVTVIDNLSSGQLTHLASVDADILFHERDLRSCPDLASLLRGQDMVFHLAAIHGGRGFVDTRGVECLANLRIDNIVLDAAVASDVEKVVFASSACVYPVTLQDESSRGYLLKEGDAGFERPGQAFPDGIYGWSKLMGELQLQAYHSAQKISGVACRLFSVYGPRQTASHSVAALVGRALRREDPFEVWGPGSQTRNFTFVSDAVSGLLRAGDSEDFAIVNVGREEAITIDDLANTVFDVLGWRPSVITHDRAKPIGVIHRAADTGTARTLLGWCPHVQLHEGLSQTVAWYGERRPLDLSEAALFAQG
jgi:nucleoside-diphosphate-sugar epimerase